MECNRAAILGVCVVVASGAGCHAGPDAVESAIDAIDQPRAFGTSGPPTTLLSPRELIVLEQHAGDRSDLLLRQLKYALNEQSMRGLAEAPASFSQAFVLPDAPPIPGWRGWESRRQFEFNSEVYLFVPIVVANPGAGGVGMRLFSVDAKRVPRAAASADGGAVDSVR